MQVRQTLPGMTLYSYEESAEPLEVLLHLLTLTDVQCNIHALTKVKSGEVYPYVGLHSQRKVYVQYL